MGAALIFGALLLLANNQSEERTAQRESSKVLPLLVDQISQNQQEQAQDESLALPEDLDIPIDYPNPGAFEMTEVEVNGYGYIGYLSIPALELELPIMADWDDTRLRIAPCRYYGSVRGENLVLMAHNYVCHFGRLSELAEGDSVSFTDMDGVTTCYEVVGKDILDPYAVEEMVAGDYDLTLFACTYSGAARVTVYCERVK